MGGYFVYVIVGWVGDLYVVGCGIGCVDGIEVCVIVVGDVDFRMGCKDFGVYWCVLY